MKSIYAQIQKVSKTNSNIYISGETGTGKSLIARLIHQNSPRAKHPFICVHCGAIPESLLESELFGHEKGSFTGADQTKLGKFELANKGTIFLDEIGTMPLVAQIKLLQIIQERKNVRVGGSKEHHVDVRIISASNEDLQQLCDEGKFRKDLYYRLNVFPIYLPALRDRKEDIPLLVNTFIKKLNQQHQSQIKGIHPKAVTLLIKYHWPGNIRELENILERAFILEESDVLCPSSFPREFEIVDHIDNKTNLISPKMTLKEIRTIEVNRIEKTYLKSLLAEYQGKISETASAAGITTRQLHKLLTKHGIKKEKYKKQV
jgi:transcriptional regulator with PAS, ATPase and Fis domain